VRRIRLVFGALAVLILVPMGLLVQRALESVELEREVSHRAVAERLLDEMERELSRLLRAEEERPFDDSHFGASASAGAGGKSDAGVAVEVMGHVAGYFQIDPDGSFRSGAGPGDAESPAAPGSRAGVRAPQEAAGEAFSAKLMRQLRSASDGLGRAPKKSNEGAAAAFRDAPAEAEAFDEENKERLDDGATRPKAKTEAAKQVSPYEALQALNKGALARSERQVKRAPARPPPPARSRALARVAGVLSDAASEQRAAAPSPPAVADIAAAEPPREFAAAAPGFDADAGDRRGIDAAVIFEEVAPVVGALEVHPMLGRLIDAEQLLLVRSVFVGDERYRQGLVVNLPALFRRLDSASVAGSSLERFVQREFFSAASALPERTAGPGYRTVRRFAEPFDALGVRLTLQPLPDVGGAGYLYAIAGLLLLSGTAGLLALYRMVAVTVRFAERRNNFVAAVSHELKTPLTAIRMYAEMLRDGMVADDDKRQSYYSTITAESERLTRLINNVLEFSRLEQGSRDTSLIVGPIGPVVREAAAILETHARESGFRLDVEVAAGLPPVRFDRDAVRQVVFNLVDNALKYARDAGDRVVAIRCVRDGDGVRLVVRDRGPGVETRHLTKIFEPFYRCEDELTRTAKGTGIGLALVRGLAEAMGADVSGQNVADGGFEVALRFRPQPLR